MTDLASNLFLIHYHNPNFAGLPSSCETERRCPFSRATFLRGKPRSISPRRRRRRRIPRLLIPPEEKEEEGKKATRRKRSKKFWNRKAEMRTFLERKERGGTKSKKGRKKRTGAAFEVLKMREERKGKARKI